MTPDHIYYPKNITKPFIPEVIKNVTLNLICQPEKIAKPFLPGIHETSTLDRTWYMLTLLALHSHVWGQSTQTISSLPPKRDWGPKRGEPKNIMKP